MEYYKKMSHFPRVSILGNTQRPLGKLIFELDMLSIVVILTLIENVEFSISHQRKHLFPRAMLSEIKYDIPSYIYFNYNLPLEIKDTLLEINLSCSLMTSFILFNNIISLIFLFLLLKYNNKQGILNVTSLI